MSYDPTHRFAPVLDAMDIAVKPFDLLAGENIYMLAVLLVGSLNEAPSDVQGMFREAVRDVLMLREGADRNLIDLCLRGKVPAKLR